MFSDYEQFEKFLNDVSPTFFTIERFSNYLKSMNDFHLKLKCIHVGGTNGKGSTTNYIRSALNQAGYRVATFNSPCFIERRDVICIDSIMIEKDVIVSYANKMIDGFLTYQLSSFEMEVAIAIAYFIDQEVDLAIIEVGLGGLDDATNVINPLLSAITNVSVDHTEYLGTEICDITKIKGGIIKQNIDFITTESKESCLNIFNTICKEKQSNMQHVDCKVAFEVKNNKLHYGFDGLNICLDTKAHYQVSNSILAICVLRYLINNEGFSITNNQIELGLNNARWKFRYEIILEQPLVLIDGAHNLEGINSFVESSKTYKNKRIIFGAFKDKDIKAMYTKLKTLSDDVIACSFDHVRSATLNDYKGFGIVDSVDCFEKIIDESLLNHNVILITGSLAFVSKAYQYVVQKKGESTF